MDIKLDFNELFDKAFSALAKGMNIAEEVLLPIMVKQMFIEGVTGLIICGAMSLIWIICILSGILYERKNPDEGGFIFAGVFLLIGGFILLMIFFADGYLMTSITKTFNPEYAVIKSVVDMATDLLNGKGE